MFTEIEWVFTKSKKISPDLQNAILNSTEFSKWMPRFLKKVLFKLKSLFIRHNLIVQLHEDIVALPACTSNDLKQKLHCKPKENLSLINGFSITANLYTLKKLVKNSIVEHVWLDHEVKALLDVATPVTGAPQLWNSSNQGEGIGIAILDTGIYPHPDLTKPKNRIIAFKDFVKSKEKPYDDNGHGTHSAGSAAGNGFQSGGRYKGPAPEANLIGVKVLDRKGSGPASRIIKGIQWCISNKNRYSIKIISLSLGAPAKQSSKNDPLCQAVKKAWNAGIIVCAAAGNTGPASKTINTPGIEPSIITVGALDDKNTITISDDTVANFSSRGPTIDGYAKPDLLAPGVKITSLKSPSSLIARTFSNADNWYITLSGTSMATPICAGVTALLLKKYPELSPNQIKNRLKQTCRKLNISNNAQGAGLVNAVKAISIPK